MTEVPGYTPPFTPAYYPRNLRPSPMNLAPIIPQRRSDPVDDPAWLFELKLDGFRGLADTVQGRMLSKNGNRMRRFECLLESLPPGYVFDGEIVALDADGRPMFNDLLFGRREPVYVAFDVLVVDGGDVRELPLKERRATLEKVVRRYGLQKSEPVLGDGKAAFRAVCGLDLEGVVAKRLGDSYGPRTKWWKILNRAYSQKKGRAQLFERRYG
jgi:bifunctional non-homologous end joining protein LigD